MFKDRLWATERHQSLDRFFQFLFDFDDDILRDHLLSRDENGIDP